MNLVALFTILLAACGHEQLDFELADGGRDEHHDAAVPPSAATADCAGSPSSISDSSHSGESVHGGPGGSVGASSDGGNDAADASDTTDVQGERYQEDPRGYATGPGQLAASCAQGRTLDEVCGNDIDEDCDGTVDEYPGIGAPCRIGCGDGMYVCSMSTNTLLCRGGQGCMNALPAPCGDGFVSSYEECDPNAPFEQAGITCTLTCERPLFIRCVEAGLAYPARCDELHVCNERIGACVPVVGPRQPRCPRLPIEGRAGEDQFYPMLEMENGECWVTCSESEQCPSSLSECYMGFCAVPF